MVAKKTDDNIQLDQEDLQRILMAYKLGPDGIPIEREADDLEGLMEAPEENIFPQQNNAVAQTMMDEGDMITRKSQSEKARQYMLDTEQDVPEHLKETFWVHKSRHNELLNLTPQEMAMRRLASRNLFRTAGWERESRGLYTYSDEQKMREFESRLFTKSIGGFERTMSSTEIVKTINEDHQIPQKQTNMGGLGGIIGRVLGNNKDR